jgi:hypothetical protein
MARTHGAVDRGSFLGLTGRGARRRKPDGWDPEKRLYREALTAGEIG